jgi:hypothetical protein
MTRVDLDGLEEPVKQFVLELVRNPAGSLLELNGQPVAWVFPAGALPPEGNGPWTEAKNQRRCDLIDRKYAVGLTPAETVELDRLQDEMLRHRHRVAPIPLEDARCLYQGLQTPRDNVPSTDE